MDTTLPQRKFDYRGWVITTELTGDGDQICARADVYRDGQLAGRVVLTASQAERETFVEKLDRKAKELVDGLLAASHRREAPNLAGSGR